MKVLIVNAGSSSLKYQLIDTTDENVIAKGLCERIGLGGSIFKYSAPGKETIKKEMPMPDHTTAVEIVLNALIDKQNGVISDMNEIEAVGHRVVHGGEKFNKSVIISDEVLATINELIDLAPLHNPANLMGINACRALMPNVPMVGVFDTAFHQTMPQHAYLYGLPYEAYSDLKIRRYGFHGASHYFVSQKVISMLGKPKEETKVIVCHLGNGSSISAVKGGKSIDTSMGFTPLEGVIMGTRSGDIDPAIVTFLMEKLNMTTNEVESYLNKKSGVLGISGVSSDFRDLNDASSAGNARATAALECFAYKVKKYIGAYIAALGGVDAIAFTAGIGENDNLVRQMIISDLEGMGIIIDKEKNMKAERGTEFEMSAPNSAVKVFVIPTDEEMVIARDTARLVKQA